MASALCVELLRFRHGAQRFLVVVPFGGPTVDVGALHLAPIASALRVFDKRRSHVVLPLLEQQTVATGWISQDAFLAGYVGGVAEKYGVSIAEFYADMARAFLMDKDGPGAKEKLAAYYHGIVKAE